MLKLNSKQLRAVDANDISSDAKSVIRNPLVFILENIYDTYNIGGIFRLADGLGVAKIYLCGDTETPPNNRIHKASCGTYKVVPWEYCLSAQNAIEKFKSNDQLPNSKNQMYSQVDGGDCVLERGTGCLSESKLEKNDVSHAKAGQNIVHDRASSVPSERIQTPPHNLQPYNLTNLKPSVIAIEQSPISIPYTSLKPTYPLALVVGNETTGVTPETLALCDKTVEIPMWGINKSLNVIVSAAIVSYHLLTSNRRK
jgi:tRNA G18 (ribose-2'-O)-methylase SpoU